MRKVEFDLDAFQQLSEWAALNKKVHARICRIIVEIGKPEPLKSDLAGCCGATRAVKTNHR